MRANLRLAAATALARLEGDYQGYADLVAGRERQLVDGLSELSGNLASIAAEAIGQDDAFARRHLRDVVIADL